MKSGRLIRPMLEKSNQSLAKLMIEHGADKSITEEFRDLTSIIIEVQEGDIMTGFEIIASMPLEEQRNIITGLCNGEGATARQPKGQTIYLKLLYRYNGEEWEVYYGKV